jgi:hypothetical protein
MLRHPDLHALPSLKEELENTKRIQALFTKLAVACYTIREEYGLTVEFMEQVIVTARDVDVNLVRAIRASYKFKKRPQNLRTK